MSGDWLTDKGVRARIFANIERRGPDDCWLWTASLTPYGYGQTWINGLGTKHAHRIVWALHHGRWPTRWELVCHHCDVKRCCNPAHLYLGSHADNMRDAAERGLSCGPGGYRVPEGLRAEIRRAYQADEGTYRQLATRYGVGATTVGRLVTT